MMAFLRKVFYCKSGKSNDKLKVKINHKYSYNNNNIKKYSIYKK